MGAHQRLHAGPYKATWLLLGLATLHAIVALVFTRGYLLSRIELPHTGKCIDGRCKQLQQYSKAVVIIVDALRYDFVCGRPSQRQPNAGMLPKTMALVNNTVGAGDERRQRLPLSSWMLAHGLMLLQHALEASVPTSMQLRSILDSCTLPSCCCEPLLHQMLGRCFMSHCHSSRAWSFASSIIMHTSSWRILCWLPALPAAAGDRR